MTMRIFPRGLLLLVVLALAGLPSLVLAQDPTPDGSSEVANALPPADLPTFNEQAYTFEITSVFNGSLDVLPVTEIVYNMMAATYTLEQAQQIADRLEIGGQVTENAPGDFSITGNGSLFVTAGLLQYTSTQATGEGTLPSDTEAIAWAREWLRQTGLLPADIGEGRIQVKIADPPQVIVIFKPVQPTPLLSSIPGITVTIGPNGAVLEAAVRWATITPGDTYALVSGTVAWSDVENRRSYINVTLPPDQYPSGSVVKGTAEYTSVTITYTSSGIPGEQQYLQPVIMFSGRLTPEGSSTSYSITAYVPGLINANQPVG